MALWLASFAELERRWRARWDAGRLAVRISDTDGGSILGEHSVDGVSLTPGDTHLPFILSVSAIGTALDAGEQTRRTVLYSSHRHGIHAQ